MRIFNQNNLPDIDALVQKWLDRFFKTPKKKPRRVDGDGLNGGGGEGGDNEPEEKQGFPLPPLPLLSSLAGAVIIVIYLLSGFFTVDANERVVMFRLGNPFDVRGPGLKWHMPFIEDYRIVNVSEVRRVEVGYRNDTKNKNLQESLMLTGNLNIIDMQFVVQYALKDPELFLFKNRFANLRAEDVVQQVGETSMREVVGRNNIDFVLYEGREATASETKTLMQSILDRYETGIEIQQVAVQNVQPPDQVQNAFEDAIKARQDRERKINEGEAYANDILPRAQGQASRIIKEAEAYKESAIIRAEGESSRFLLLAGEYAQAPEITRRRLYLETMEDIMGRANKIVIDDLNSNNLLYLPLDKLSGAALRAIINNEGSGGGGESSGLDSNNAAGQRLRSGADALREYLK